tara:strand:+ start:55 stop:291 length:237 start_codon:yes stop_codon:yes gene_type:complete
MSKTPKILMRNFINVLTHVKNSKKEIEKINKINIINSNPIINSKENSIKNINLELEKQLNYELTCINATTADVGKIKK